MQALVIGVGNPHRGDDGAGLAVIERLASSPPRGVRLLSCAGDPLRIIEHWEGSSCVFVADAMRSGRPPGAVERFDVGIEPLPAERFLSTHTLGLAQSIELARAIDRMPARLIVYGIQGEDFSLGAALGRAADAAAVRAASCIRSELEQLGRAGGAACERVRVP